MASLKDIKRHIVAVKQTQKLTKAMNMVAAAKLRGTQARTEQLRAFAEEHARLLHELAGRTPVEAHPLLKANAASDKVAILALSSDRGLCGSFNTNIFHLMNKRIADLVGSQLTPELFLVGRKLRDHYHRRPYKVVSAMVNVMATFDFMLARKIADDVTQAYLRGEYREVWLVYTKFKSLTRYEVTAVPFLPLSREQAHATADAVTTPAGGHGFDYEIEPSAAELFSRLIPRSLALLIFQAMLESATSENAARMQAMDNANRNCKEMIESLSLSYNKARQAAVTSELLDIVGGAEALNG